MDEGAKTTRTGPAVLATPLTDRTTSEVFEDHLRRATSGDTEGDVAANYSENVILLTGIGELRGHDGVRESRAVLAQDLPSGQYEYLTKLVSGEYAFLEWRGDAAEGHVEDGADGFVIRNGRIEMQSIHYTVRHRTGYHQRIEHARSSSPTERAASIGEPSRRK